MYPDPEGQIRIQSEHPDPNLESSNISIYWNKVRKMSMWNKVQVNFSSKDTGIRILIFLEQEQS